MRHTLFRRLAALSFLAPFHFAHAGFTGEADALYYSRSVTTQGESAASDLFLGGFAGATFGKRFFIGFRFDYFSDSSLVNTRGSELGGTSWGARFGFTLGKTRWAQLAAVYYPFASASLSENGASVGSLSGSGYQAEFAIVPKISERAYIGLKLIYRQLSFSQLVTPSEQANTISFSHTKLYPCLVFGYRMD